MAISELRLQGLTDAEGDYLEPHAYSIMSKIEDVYKRQGVETLVHQLGDDVALDLQAAGGDVHQLVEAAGEVGLVLGEVGETRHVQRDDADGAGALAGAEVRCV